MIDNKMLWRIALAVSMGMALDRLWQLIATIIFQWLKS